MPDQEFSLTSDSDSIVEEDRMEERDEVFSSHRRVSASNNLEEELDSMSKTVTGS